MYEGTDNVPSRSLCYGLRHWAPKVRIETNIDLMTASIYGNEQCWGLLD